MAVKMPKKVTLMVGETAEVKAVVKPTTATHQRADWGVDDTSVVSLSGFGFTNRFVEGTIHGTSPGVATITATIKEFDVYGSTKNMQTFTDTCIVRVVRPRPIIYLSPEFMAKGPGAGNYGNERPKMEELADKLHDYLQNQGYNSINGRRDIDELTAAAKDAFKRTEESNTLEADLHIALHSNAYNGIATRPVTFYTLPGTFTYSSANVNGLTHVVTNTVSQNQSNEGKALSESIQESLFTLYKESFPNATDRGVISNEFIELRAVNAVSSYVEVAFHDNLNDANWIMDNMSEITQTIGDGIINYIQNAD